MAMDTVYPAERHRRPRISPSATPVPPVTGAAAGRAWLDAERAALVAVTVHAAGHGWAAHATRLSETLFRYLITAVTTPRPSRSTTTPAPPPGAPATGPPKWPR